jgi:hypothetical protein
MTVDENFIVQKHPQWENVWIAGGGSGHGFKQDPSSEYVGRFGKTEPDPRRLPNKARKPSEVDPLG